MAVHPGGGFYWSDCFVNLIDGPPWGSWYCWSEAMDRIHDHMGYRWCNGTRNCSPFVHCGNKNYQGCHQHNWPWRACWGW